MSGNIENFKDEIEIEEGLTVNAKLELENMRLQFVIIELKELGDKAAKGNTSEKSMFRMQNLMREFLVLTVGEDGFEKIIDYYEAKNDEGYMKDSDLALVLEKIFTSQAKK